MIAQYLTTLLANGCRFSIEPLPDFKSLRADDDVGVHVELRIFDGETTWAVGIPPDMELGSAVERWLGFFIRNRNWPICERL